MRWFSIQRSLLIDIDSPSILPHPSHPGLALFQDTGLFGLYAVVPPEQLEGFTYTVMGNFVRMAHDVTEDELSKAKTQLKVRLSHIFA